MADTNVRAPDLHRTIYDALVETQIATNAITELASILIDDATDSRVTNLMEAILACVQRIDAAVNPLAGQVLPLAAAEYDQRRALS